jgi:pyroglutamyl-peptidase
VSRRPLLVTGFEPFAGHDANPAEAVAKALDGRAVGDIVVRGVVLPVHHVAAAAEVSRLLDELDPRAVVHLGLAGGRARIALERVALNVMDYEEPDNAGYRAGGEPCVVGGPPAYFATLPLTEIVAAMVAEGIPAYVSNTAGTYLCNQTLYTTLHRLAGRPRALPVGFIHLPLLPAMVAATGLEQPSMDAGTMVRAVEIALGVLVRVT